MRKIARMAATMLICLFACAHLQAQEPERLKALIIDGQNNHDWRHTTPILKWILEQSGRFTVDVSTTPERLRGEPNLRKNATPEQKDDFIKDHERWLTEKATYDENRDRLWSEWNPHFSDYAVIISNYNGELWPKAKCNEFEAYVGGGGGFVSVHAADNAFNEWPEYNLMIGVGGWNFRGDKSGPMLRVRDGKTIRDNSPGPGGMHGQMHEFLVEAVVPDHPILKGLPLKWRHARDELYGRLRGPALNLTVLATAFSGPDKGGTSENEPMLMVINYKKGRVFHTTLGHAPESMYDIGFQTVLARGAEWAATGAVTIPAPPADQMPEDKPVMRPPPKN